MSRILDLHITSDEKHEYIAAWHDESHLNMYANIILKNTARRLSANFHVPEEIKTRYPDRRLMYLNKNSDNLLTIKEEQYHKPRQGGKIIANKYNKFNEN
jgi:hypothetical protein